MLLIPIGKGRFWPPVTNEDNEPDSVEIMMNGLLLILRTLLLIFQ